MNKIFNTKLIAIVAISIVGVFVSSAFLQEDKVDAEIFVEQNGVDKAVIIDQLYDELPNKYFHKTATKYLEDAGYEVDIFTTEDVTVDFYKKLPEMNYKFVVIRSHGADDAFDNDVVLFTGERYQEDKYIHEQLFGLVKKATPFLEVSYSSNEGSSEWIIVNDTYRYQKSPAVKELNTEEEFFSISPKLIQESMNGKFHGTTFLLGGCSTLANPSMAKSLVERGASNVVGWDNTVSSGQNDWALLEVLEETLMNNLDVKDAVELVMSDFEQDIDYPATLKHYS